MSSPCHHSRQALPSSTMVGRRGCWLGYLRHTHGQSRLFTSLLDAVPSMPRHSPPLSIKPGSWLPDSVLASSRQHLDRAFRCTFVGVPRSRASSLLSLMPRAAALFYTKNELGLRLAYWFGFAAVAGAFGGLLAFGVQHAHAAIANWRLLFLIEVCYPYGPAAPRLEWLSIGKPVYHPRSCSDSLPSKST